MISLATPFISPFKDNSSNRLNGLRALLLLCLLVVAATPARAQESATAEQAPATTTARTRAVETLSTGSITGRVVSEDGRPLADTVVLLNRMYARAPGPPTNATTDSDGKFLVSGLEAGLYSVNAMQPGFTVPDALTDTSEPAYYRIGDSVNLTLLKGGVITGTVRDANGEPVIAVPVRTLRLRDSLGRPATGRFTGFYPDRMTDDRGVYRIYGLPPGTYLVSAGGSQRLILTNAYENDAPTFFPSSTRDTAAEVPVRAGEEATNVDIRYRGERGHTISGTVSGFLETKMPAGVSITLRQAAGGGFETTTFIMPNVKTGFALNGVSDGVYELAAQQWGVSNDSAASIPRRVTIKGADLTGIELVLSPLASISGRVQLEAPPKETCADGRGGTLTETAINARRDQKNQTEEASRFQFFSSSGGVPNNQGEFTIPNLLTGTYRLSVRLPSDAWYVRSISLPSATVAAAQPTAPAKSAQPKSAATAVAAPSSAAAASSPVVTLATGARLANVTVQIAQDAAGLRGRVVSAAPEGAEGASLPANLRVYLVPAERERAEDVLRYSEATAASDGVFSFQNLAPGRYWLIARSVPETETPERTPRPLAWDADTRVKLRREAEAANTAIELQPCQRAVDYALRYATAK